MTRWIQALLLATITTAAFAQAPPPVTASTVTEAVDSRQTREDFQSVLRKYPPQVGAVLKIDPGLFHNQSFMANYPALTAFIERHPEVVQSPSYFLGTYIDGSASDRAERITTGDVAGFTIFIVVTYVLVWIVKTLIEQRRWSHLSAVRSEVHGKLLDRFTSNEELLTYLQSDAGKKFLESSPIPLEPGARPMSAPLGRVFMSMQAGLVLVAAGIGFDLVSLRTQGANANVLYGIGVIALMIGVALMLSAAFLYVVSRRAGLWKQTES